MILNWSKNIKDRNHIRLYYWMAMRWMCQKMRLDYIIKNGGISRQNFVKPHKIRKNDMCNCRTPPFRRLEAYILNNRGRRKNKRTNKQITALKMHTEKENGWASRWLENDRCFFFHFIWNIFWFHVFYSARLGVNHLNYNRFFFFGLIRLITVTVCLMQ